MDGLFHLEKRRDDLRQLLRVAKGETRRELARELIGVNNRITDAKYLQDQPKTDDDWYSFWSWRRY